METPSPIGALALGFVPGMGHYYTGRPRGGTVVFALTGGALAAGLFIQDVTVVCLNDVPAGEQCPSAQVVEEVADRPFLLPSLGVAAAVTIIGAVDAMVRARSVRRQVEEINGPRTATGPRLAPPSLSSRGRRVDLNLLRVTFN